MRFLDNISIKRRLVGATLLIVFAFFAMTWFSAHEILHVTRVAKTIYEHPLQVSNAAMAAMAETRRMQEHVEELLHAENNREIEKEIADIDHAEQGVLKQLDVVRNLILGEEGQLLEKETRAIFMQRKPVRDRAIALFKEGKKRRAAAIIKKDKAEYYSEIYAKEAELNVYARNKASGFINELNISVKRIQYRELLFLFIGVVLAGGSAGIVFRSIFISLKRLRDTMENDAEYGSLTDAVVSGRNEIADMAKSFNSLVKVVRKHRENLEELVKAKTKDLEESREWFSTTLKSIGDAVIATDGDGRVNFMNPVAEALTGWRSDEANGKPLKEVFNIINEHTRERVENPVAMVLKIGGIVGLANHTVLISKDGKERPIVDSGAPITAPDGDIIGVALIFRDDTERREAERKIEESRKWLSTTLNSIGDAVIATDAEGRVSFMNPTAENLTGWPSDEARGMPLETVFNIVNEETRAVVENPVAKVIETGGVVGLANHTVLISKDGREFPIVDSGAPITSPGGDIVGVVLVFMDDTERRRSEAALRKSEFFLRESQKAARVGSYATDLKAGTWKCSEVLDEIFGVPVDYDKTVEGWVGIVHPEHKDMMAQYFNEILADKANFEKEYKILRKSDGAERWVMGYGTVRYEADGTPIDMIGTIQDITERKRAEELREALHVQEKFATVGKVAGKLAHDFNNMLGIIVGTSELLLTDNLPEEIAEEIEIIKNSALKGRDITKNLLLFAKDQETRYTSFDINEKIALLLNTLKADLVGAQVTVDQGAGLTQMVADAGMIENALINLIQNSLHAMGKTEKPRLKIRTYEGGGNINISIEDNGCGVPPEYGDKIFEPTVTLKGSGDRAGAYNKDIKGSGYGLSNVKRCAEKHGGTISFESGAGGTKFALSIPVIKSELTEEEMKKAGADKVEKGKRILVVEDEQQLGRILYSLLSNFGHSVHLASDGKMALEHLKSNCYDAVTLDFLLPDMTGLDIYKAIRKTDAGTPVVFVSGNFEFMQSMVDLKKTDPRVEHLAKPFEGVDFVNAVNRALCQAAGSV